MRKGRGDNLKMRETEEHDVPKTEAGDPNLECQLANDRGAPALTVQLFQLELRRVT